MHMVSFLPQIDLLWVFIGSSSLRRFQLTPTTYVVFVGFLKGERKIIDLSPNENISFIFS